ncbi:MAG: BtpA/SgcQ family protein [Spirochaetales bacterium]|nr:BtpA/SgcQ family protein [Spirochaetales bacterium]MCF7936996.1 BtpA/SgcQ family protein [Spirochaetales bacterium]
MIDLTKIFGKKSKIIIGMVHFPPLPGTPLYDESKQTLEDIYRIIREDLLALQEGGIDAVMFCNENDRPYTFNADFMAVAAMSGAINAVRDQITVPYGVDVLWDAKAALALAKATGAQFIREIVSGAYISDMGFWNTQVGEVYRYRKQINADHVAVFFNIFAEFASRLDNRPLDIIAKSVEFSSLADAILVSGPLTGQAPTGKNVEEVKRGVSIPVFINTGLKVETADDLLSAADGAVVGTSLKKDGVTWNQVEVARVKKLMDKVNQIRT